MKYTEITEVNLSTFIYRLFHEDFSSIDAGITRGRMLSGELYAQIFQKLVYLHLIRGCFMKTSPQSSEQTQLSIVFMGFWGVFCLVFFLPIEKKSP